MLKDKVIKDKNKLVFLYSGIDLITPGIDSTFEVLRVRKSILAEVLRYHRTPAAGAAHDDKRGVVRKFFEMLRRLAHGDEGTAKIDEGVFVLLSTVDKLQGRTFILHFLELFNRDLEWYGVCHCMLKNLMTFWLKSTSGEK